MNDESNFSGKIINKFDNLEMENLAQNNFGLPVEKTKMRSEQVVEYEDTTDK